MLTVQHEAVIDPEKSRARSRESYKKDFENSRDDSAVRIHESYLKNPEKSRVWNGESYMRDQEKSCADNAARTRKNYKKDLEKSRWNDTGLAISCKSKKIAAA